MTLAAALNGFYMYLEIEKNRSLLTLRNYKLYLDRFSGWLATKIKEQANLSDITPELITFYRIELNREGIISKNPLDKSTQAYHLIALRSFLRYLTKKNIPCVSPDVIELPKMPARQVEYIEGLDLSRFLEAPMKAEQPELLQKRDSALLSLLFSTGLRVSELAKLQKEQVPLNKEEFTVRGKGRKLRVVFLSDDARDRLKAYLAARQDLSPALFVRHDPGNKKKLMAAGAETHLTPRSVQRLVEKYAVMAGIPKNVTPHTLRHSFATDLLANGADIRSVQAILGHSSITTTQIYTHVSDKHLKEVFKKFHGKGDK